MTEFEEYYKNTTEKLKKIIKEYNDNLPNEKSKYLKNNLEIFSNLNSDGKLIRGILITLGYKFFNKNIDYSLRLALAYEIFQTSILIHDDIIDNDNLRRGKETVHYTNYNKHKEYNEQEAKKLSESVAICIGDYGFFDGNQVIVKNYKNDKNFGNIMECYNDIVLKTIEGELIDIMLPFYSKYSLVKEDLEDNIMLIYKLKTAYYTIIGPLCLGMILAGGSEDKISDITTFAEKVGIAFQIQDDILGIYYDMGKIKGSDIKEFKQTILFSYVYQTEYKDELLKYYGNDDIDDDKIEKIKDIFNKSGAYEYANNQMLKYYDLAIKDLENIKWLDLDDKNILVGLIDYLKSRKK